VVEVQTHEGWAPDPGGAAETGHAIYVAAPQTMLDDTTNLLSFALFDGDPLLDLTDPTIPVAIRAGVYAVSIRLSCTSGDQVGKYAAIALNVGSVTVSETGPIVATDAGDPGFSLGSTYLVDTGSPAIYPTVYFKVGSTLDWTATMNVQKVS